MLVYDVTDFRSFSSLDYWLEAIRKCNNENIVIFSIGNKIDKIDDIEVSNEIVEEYNKTHELKFHYKVSAKNNLNLDEMFKCFYTEIYNTNKDNLVLKQEHLKKLKENRLKIKYQEKNKCC